MQAAIREAGEEVGIQVEKFVLIGGFESRRQYK